jgi:hypothetical protein
MQYMVYFFKFGWPMTKSCALLNFDRLYVTSYDVIWKKGGKQIMGQYEIIIDLVSMELYTCEQE